MKRVNNIKNINIMKKQIIIISLILAIFSGYAQETIPAEPVKEKKVKDYCPHRINLHAGTAFTNNIYARSPEVHRIYSMGHLFDIGYTYFFNKTVGLGLGIGVEDLSAKLKSNIHGIVPNLTYPQQEGKTYDLLYSTNELIEKQHIFAINVPLTVQFEHKFKEGKNGIYAGVGVQGFFPIIASSKMKKGELITRGYEEEVNVLYQNDMPQHGLGTYNFKGASKIYNITKEDLRVSVDVVADFGGIFEINNKVDFYVGLFGSYSFLDILPKAEFHHPYADVAPTEQHVKYNGLLGSNYLELFNEKYETNLKTAFNVFQIGVKVGIHIKPCYKVNQTLRNQFYEEMIKRANDPITDRYQKSSGDEGVRTITNTEIIYIIPQYTLPGEEPKPMLQGTPLVAKQSNKENANIRELVEVLSVTRILFDVDKDDPKLAQRDEENINKVAEILSRDPSLVLIVEGYTDPTGSREHNIALGKRRAENTRNYFISKGVPADQIETYSYTADEPEAIQNIQSTSYAQKRAAIFRIKRK
jgi:outer membrane protein OmpA-like peptidoglycan-associated protein